MESFKINTKETKSNYRYERYLNFADENSIFSKYSLYPEQELTRGMMAHLATSLIRTPVVVALTDLQRNPVPVTEMKKDADRARRRIRETRRILLTSRKR